MTLAATQLELERSFSTSKIISSKLRSILSQEQLATFMPLSTEQRMLDEIPNDAVVEKFFKTGKELSILLTF